MPPDQPEVKSDTPKKHQRSRSLDMTRGAEVIDLTKSAKTEDSSSRKHHRNNQDPQAEGPSKRPKHSRDSEPPMRKDTSMTPRMKRKKLRKEINNCKASRTSKYQKLKERVANLERAVADANNELTSVKKAHSNTKQVLEETEQELKDAVEDLECQLKSSRQELQGTKQELQGTKQELQGTKQELQGTKQELQDTKQDLTDTKKNLASTIAELDNAHKTVEAKSEEVRKQQSVIKAHVQQIQSLRALVDDPTSGLVALQQSCQSKEGDLKAKDTTISAQQEELHKTTEQNMALKETLDEANTALKNARSNYDDCRNQLMVREEKLRSTGRALEEEQLAREGAQKEVDALHLVNAKQGYQTHRVVLREEKAKSDLKSERKENKALLEKNAELQTHGAELQATIQRHNYKEPDEKIKKDFASLGSKIQQFVDKFARPVADANDEELKALWPNWSPRLREFLASPLLCNQVLEAYVWECLVGRIFSHGSRIWAGELGQLLEKTLSMAADEIDEAGFKSDLYIDLQHLRSSSSRLISRVDGANWRPNYFEPDVNTMSSTLAKLVGLNETNGAMQAEAMKIFELARALEIQLRILKAIHTVQMHKPAADGERLKYGFNAADEDMEDRSPDQRGMTPGQGPLVDFIMCPGLYKRGTNSGTNYGTTSCLIKMGVVCNATELCLKPGPSTPVRPGPNQGQATLRSGKVRHQNDCNIQDLSANSADSAKGHSRPPRAAKGQGGGSTRKKAKTSGGSESDPEYVP